jgi:peroxiredoxin
MTSAKKQRRPTIPPPQQPKSTKQRRTNVVSILVLGSLVALTFIVLATRSNSAGDGKTSAAGYAIGNPGPGAQAPDFSLPSTSGGTVHLSDYRGKTVLLFFHEGIGCQPCWDQIRDLENVPASLASAGIDKLLTITSGPTRLIAQKMADENLTSIALGDTNLDISKTYNANQYGMMGDSRDGHSFLLIGPKGIIEWRADYGGPPKYTMYVPVEKILSDLKTGRVGA